MAFCVLDKAADKSEARNVEENQALPLLPRTLQDLWARCKQSSRTKQQTGAGAGEGGECADQDVTDHSVSAESEVLGP